MTKMSNNKPRHRQQGRPISFPRVVAPMGLVAIASISLIGVMTGMRYISTRTSAWDHSRSKDYDQIEYSRVRIEVDTAGRDKHEGSQDANSRRVIFLEIDDGRWMKQHLRGKSNITKRVINVNKHSLREQVRLLDSEDFSYRDPLYEGECTPMTEWQTTSFPNCNMFHELDIHGKVRRNELEYFTSGGYNDIFFFNERSISYDPEMALKILIFGTDYSDRNFDRVRRDALILERLTKSPHILNSYGYCGFDVITPFAHGGTLTSTLKAWRKGKLELSHITRLQYAVNVSASLAAVHGIDGKGLSSVAHGDLHGKQFLFLNDEMKLGDFNRGRFLRKNLTDSRTACTYKIGKNDAAFRSPEEYLYEPQTSAIDVYALGSILYQLLTGNEVWHNTDTKEAQKLITEGQLPVIDDEIVTSENPIDMALREAIAMCYIYDPKLRASAADVASYLKSKLSELTAG